MESEQTVAFGGIWLAAAWSIVSIHSSHTPLDRFSNTKSNTEPRSGNVLFYARIITQQSNRQTDRERERERERQRERERERDCSFPKHNSY